MLWVSLIFYRHQNPSRTDTKTCARLSGPADVFATANGPPNWKNDSAPDHRDVVWKEQASPRVLVQHSKEQVRNSINRIIDRHLMFVNFTNRVDELYRFLNSWVAHIYGELDEEVLKLRGFELIQHDTEWSNNRTSSKVSAFVQFLHRQIADINCVFSGRRWHRWRNRRVHERIVGGEFNCVSPAINMILFCHPKKIWKCPQSWWQQTKKNVFLNENSLFLSLFSFWFLRFFLSFRNPTNPLRT